MSNDQSAAAAAIAQVSANNEPNGSGTQQATAPTDPRFEQFANKERQLQKQRDQFAKERAEWESKVKQYDTDYVPKSRLTSDPLAALQDNGFTVDQLAELILNQPNMNDPATKAVMGKLKALEDKQAKAEQDAQASSQKAYDQAVAQINTEVKMLVDSDPAYETIKASDMQEAVTHLIEQTFSTEGYVMSVSDAAAQVEAELVEQGYKLAQLSKIQARLKPAADTAVNAKQTQAPKMPQGTKTLSNTTPSASSAKQSEAARRARAIAAFQGKQGQ